jgi:hypothetical protein
MPECYFFTTYGECGNDECIFLHIDPEKKRVECPWYARGFCRHGADCKNRHTRKASVIVIIMLISFASHSHTRVNPLACGRTRWGCTWRLSFGVFTCARLPPLSITLNPS